MSGLIARALCLISGLALSGCAAMQDDAAGPDEGEIFYNPVDRVGEAAKPARRDGGGDAVALLAGAWSNADQYAFAPEDLKRPPAPGRPYDWIDLQHAEFHPVEAPAIGAHVLYLEWRSGAADGEISRQRIWAFREAEGGALSGMDFYTFADPEPYAGRGAEPGAFADLTADDLIAYPEGCTLQARNPAWDGHVLEVSADDCVITARSGRTMGIEARVEIAPDRVSYREAGILEDGSYAFLVPGGPAYEFRRPAALDQSGSRNKSSSKSSSVVKAVQ
ncbi:MAG: chromophore lyase CpcT/CpeT [Oceanicaulis sp.]